MRRAPTLSIRRTRGGHSSRQVVQRAHPKLATGPFSTCVLPRILVLRRSRVRNKTNGHSDAGPPRNASFPTRRVDSAESSLFNALTTPTPIGPASPLFLDHSSSSLSRRQQRDAIACLHATKFLCGQFGDPSNPDNWSIVRKASLSLTNEIRRTMPNEVVWSPTASCGSTDLRDEPEISLIYYLIRIKIVALVGPPPGTLPWLSVYSYSVSDILFIQSADGIRHAGPGRVRSP